MTRCQRGQWLPLRSFFLPNTGIFAKLKNLQKRFSQFLWSPGRVFFYTKKGGSKISRRCPLEKGTSFSFPWAGCNYNDTGTVADIRGRSPPIRSPRSTFPATAGNNCSRNIPVGTYLICCCSADPANSVAHPKTISFRLGSRFEPILSRIPASGKTNS